MVQLEKPNPSLVQLSAGLSGPVTAPLLAWQQREHTHTHVRKYGTEAQTSYTPDGTLNGDGMPGGEAANIPCCASTERQHVSTRLCCAPAWLL